MRADLRLLRNDCCIDIHDAPVARGDLPRGLLKKDSARRATPLRVRVRKERSDVAFANRAQHGIADGVHQYVRVRMSLQAFAMRNLDTA